MKKWLYAASLGLMMTVSVGVQASDKIAIVNVGSVYEQMPASKALGKQLENEFKGRTSELQSMERNIQTKVDNLKRDGATMKASERSKVEKNIMEQRDQFIEKAKAFENDNRRRYMEERGKIVSRIQDAVKVVAKKGGYDVVLQSEAVFYTDSSKDITADVLKQVK